MNKQMEDLVEKGTRRIADLSDRLRKMTADAVKNHATIEIVLAILTLADMEFEGIIDRSLEKQDKVSKEDMDVAVMKVVEKLRSMEKTNDWTVMVQGAVRFSVALLMAKYVQRGVLLNDRNDLVAAGKPIGNA